MLLALCANPGNLDHRVVDCKTDIISQRLQSGIAVFELGHLITITTNQKLSGTEMPRMHTTDEGIAAFDAMNQSLGQQKFQRSIDDRWSDTIGIGSPIQFSKNVIGTQRLMTCQQDFEDLAASRCETQFTRLTHAPGRGQQLALATAMIVFAKCDVGRLIITRHNVIL